MAALLRSTAAGETGHVHSHLMVEVATSLPFGSSRQNRAVAVANGTHEYTNKVERKGTLAKLIGIEDRLFIQIKGQTCVYAFADEDMERENVKKPRQYISSDLN